MVGAGFLSSAHYHSPDGLCIERESEGRAALTGSTRTVTRPWGEEWELETPLAGTKWNRFTPNMHHRTCKRVMRQNQQPRQKGCKRGFCLGLDYLQHKQTSTIPLHCGEHDAERCRTQMLPATLRWSRDQTAVCSFMKLIHEAKQERKDWAHKRDADLWKETSQTAQEKLPVCQYESALCIFLDSPYNHNYTLELSTAPRSPSACRLQ